MKSFHFTVLKYFFITCIIMQVSARVVTGVLRGKPLIDRIYFRLVGILGFTPFKGTLDLKLEEPIDISRYATKSIEHKITDSSTLRECWLAPVIIKFGNKEHDCWAMQQCNGINPKDIVEIIAKEKLRDVLGIGDNDMVKIEFIEHKQEKKDGRLWRHSA